jgi:beta-xylosidase
MRLPILSSLFVAALAGLAQAALSTRTDDFFTNPILYEDLADIDIIRVNDTYYYSASTMHYSPGAPLLKSYDLVNWEFVGHSVPELSFGSKYYLNGSGKAYVNGIWASSIGYRKSNGMFYWYGCIDFAKTYVFTAKDPAGEWTSHPPIDECYYDVGLLIDDDDTMYVAYGTSNITVTQLSSDGLKPVKTQV